MKDQLVLMSIFLNINILKYKEPSYVYISQFLL